MRIIIVFLIFLFFLPLYSSQQDPCENEKKDANEVGVDCGVKACGVPCYTYIGEELPLPGEKAEDNSRDKKSTNEEKLPDVGGIAEEVVQQQPVRQSVSIDFTTIKNLLLRIVYYTLYLSLFLGVLVGVIGFGYYSYMYFTASSPLDPDVVNYIKHCLGRKIPKEEIYAKLKAAGHKQKLIDRHFHRAVK